MRVRVGALPCTFNREAPHPVGSIEGRRIARFRRHLEGGIRYKLALGATIYYVVIAMRYDQLTGRLKGNLRYSTQRFIQLLRRGEHRKDKKHRRAVPHTDDCWKRKPVELEYLRVVEPNGRGIKNHANLILAVQGELPSKHELKDIWATATYGTSFELETSQVKEKGIGQLATYLAKFLGSYLSKTFDETLVQPTPEGLDRSYQTATGKRVSEYVTTSRNWLPTGAEREWKRLFKENAFFWLCDRGFYHTNLGETAPKWFAWIDRQAWGST